MSIKDLNISNKRFVNLLTEKKIPKQSLNRFHISFAKRTQDVHS